MAKKEKPQDEEPPRELTYAERALVARFVQAMDAEGVSSNGLAKRTGVDRRTIDRLRNGERIPRPEKLGRLVQPLGVSLDWVIAGEGARERPMVSEPAGPEYTTGALAQSVAGFLSASRRTWCRRSRTRLRPSTPTTRHARAAPFVEARVTHAKLAALRGRSPGDGLGQLLW